MKLASQVLAAPLSDKRLQFWTTRSNQSLWSCWEYTFRYRAWTPDTDHWTPSDPPFQTVWAAAAPLSDGRLQVWAADTNGDIWSCWKSTTASTSPWSAWTKSWTPTAPSFKTARVAAAPLSDGRLQVWAVDTNGDIWSCWKSTTASTSPWSAWTKSWTPTAPSFKTAMVAAAPLSDGRLQVWAVDTNGDIWSCWKSTTASTSPWSAWTKSWTPTTPSFKTAMVAAAPLSDGRLQVWAVDADGRIWSCWKSTTASTAPWAAWTSNWSPDTPLFTAAMVFAARLWDKRLQFWVVDTDGEIWTCTKTTTASAAQWTAFGLFFTMQPQEQTQWCWAATSASVSHFYDPASTWRQCDVVNDELGQTTCCDNGRASRCNKPWYLDRALSRTGNLNHWGSGAAPEADLGSEIDGGRPLAARIGWRGGGGHFVALAGCGSNHMVLVRDPWYGRSYIAYTAFRDNYQGSGTWTHSYYTEA